VLRLDAGLGGVASGIDVLHATTKIRRSQGARAPLSYAAAAVASPKAVEAITICVVMLLPASS
jgi:hypothetical protein